MSTNRGMFSQLLAPGLLQILFQELEQWDEEYSSYLRVGTTKNAYEEDQIIAGLGAIVPKPEGAPITYSDPIQGGSKRYVPDGFALGWQITREMRDHDRYNIMSRIPSEFGRSMKEKVERIGIAVLDGSFSTVTTADGAAFISSSHPLLGGGSYANLLTATDISVTSIQDIILIFENMVDERGRKMKLPPKKLWIAPEQQFITARTLQSHMDPESGERSINPVYGRLEPHVLHYKASTTTWHVSAGDRYNYTRFLWDVKPEMDSEDDFETKGTKHSIYFRCVAGVTDWRGWAGSNP